MSKLQPPLAEIKDYPAWLDSCWREHLLPRSDDAPTVVSLFAGCGGSSLGYSMAGFKELAAVEWDNNAVETFKLNFPGIPVYHGDIAKLTADELLTMSGLQPGQLDVLDGSPPCQGFSTAGKRIMDDPRNGLFKEYVRLLRGLKPKVFVMENVSGMVKGKMKLIFAEIMRELKASGYKASCRLMNTMWFGVPQSRQRVIFIGVRDDLGIAPGHPKAEYRPVTVGMALRVSSDVGFMQYRNNYSRGGVVNLVDVSFERPSLTITKASNFSVKRYGDKISDLSRPLGTITKLSRWFIDEKNEFSLDAYKRLASYSDSFCFTDFSNGKARIGNSVPPLFMRSIALHIRREILEKIA